MIILLIGDRNSFIRWKDTFVPKIMKAWIVEGRHEFRKVTFLLIFLLILSGGSESRGANSGGSAQDNAVSKGIRGSRSSWGLWMGCKGRIGMDVSVIRMVIILLSVEGDPMRECRVI
jgi:hypothetical protein